MLTIFGSHYADRIDIGWQPGRYLIDADTDALVSGLCDTTQNPGEVSCDADFDNLNGMLVYGNDGPDSITIESQGHRPASTFSLRYIDSGSISRGSGKP